jgi:hypothetical protein
MRILLGGEAARRRDGEYILGQRNRRAGEVDALEGWILGAPTG